MCPLFVLSIDAVLWLDAPCSDRANHTVPKFYPSNIVTSRSLISTMECLPRRFYGGITTSISRWNNVFQMQSSTETMSLFRLVAVKTRLHSAQNHGFFLLPNKTTATRPRARKRCEPKKKTAEQRCRRNRPKVCDPCRSSVSREHCEQLQGEGKGLRSEVWGSHADKAALSLGREPVRRQVWKEHGYAVQNFTKSSTSTIHCSAFAAMSFQSYQCLIRENCSNLLAQCIAGRPTGPLPNCCHCSIRRAHRSWGRLMM